MRKSVILFFFCYLCIGCNNPDHVVNKDKLSNDLILIKEQSNKVEVGYYVDLKKSPITKVYMPDEERRDYVNFIVEPKTPNNCRLDLIKNIPDGHIEILKDTIRLLHLEFILKGDCKGFYSDFSKNPKKYDISSEGISELTKLMELTRR